MKEKTIFALGFFDGVHLGHQALLRACRQLADRVGCQAGAVTFSSHPDALVQGGAPVLIQSRDDRNRLLRQYGMDTVVELPFDKSMMTMPWQAFIRLLTQTQGAAGFVCGEDFRFGHLGHGSAALLESYCREENLPCVVVPQQLLDGIPVSSTHIRALLQGGKLTDACRFLGHPYSLTGEVVSGRKLGRTIGIPTANLLPPAGVLTLPYGVYACKAHTPQGTFSAVTNVGTRPTVQGHHVTVEAWLLDFDADLYGQTITLEFDHFLRPEQTFASLEALQQQIWQDAAQVRRLQGKK